tara:strand:+ start:731 stop:1060 length:330 start_codon:yes stop_codon:yes gene_type:complete
MDNTNIYEQIGGSVARHDKAINECKNNEKFVLNYMKQLEKDRYQNPLYISKKRYYKNDLKTLKQMKKWYEQCIKIYKNKRLEPNTQEQDARANLKRIESQIKEIQLAIK